MLAPLPDRWMIKWLLLASHTPQAVSETSEHLRTIALSLWPDDDNGRLCDSKYSGSPMVLSNDQMSSPSAMAIIDSQWVLSSPYPLTTFLLCRSEKKPIIEFKSMLVLWISESMDPNPFVVPSTNYLQKGADLSFSPITAKCINAPVHSFSWSVSWQQHLPSWKKFSLLSWHPCTSMNLKQQEKFHHHSSHSFVLVVVLLLVLLFQHRSLLLVP